MAVLLLFPAESCHCPYCPWRQFLTGSFLRRVLHSLASYGTHGGACINDRGRQAVMSSVWPLTDKMTLLWKGQKGDVETAVPRIRR